MTLSNNNQYKIHHKDVCEENSTETHSKEIPDGTTGAEFNINCKDDIESLASTVTFIQRESITFGKLDDSMIISEDELGILDACTCTDCWSVYRKYEGSSNTSCFGGVEDVSDNAYDNVLQWLSKNVEHQDEQSNRNFAAISNDKRNSENISRNNNENIKEQEEQTYCTNDESRCNSPSRFEVEIDNVYNNVFECSSQNVELQKEELNITLL